MGRKPVPEWRTFDVWRKQIIGITRDLLNKEVLEEIKAGNTSETARGAREETYLVMYRSGNC